MAAEKKMKIFVGQPRPKEAVLGYLENDNATVKGKETPLAGPIGGMQIIPNRSIIWAIRLNKEGKVPENKLQANDPKYTGMIKPVEWGTLGGMPVTTRYKSGSHSIDYDYQVLQMGMKKFEEDVEDNYLQLPFGEYNIFDSEEAKALFLSTTHENIDSLCRNPDVTGGNIRMVKAFESKKTNVQQINKEFEAVKIVNNANTFEHLSVIKSILSDKTNIIYDQSDESSIFDSIVVYAKENPSDFLNSFKLYEDRVSAVIEKFRSYKAYDTTVNGTLRGGQDKKEILISGIDAKGEDMIQYIFDYRLEPEVFETITKMIVMAQNFK